MWVVETESGVKPVIARGALAELLTKTRQDEEQDDDTLFMLETITKTYHRTESDDESFSGPSQVLELLSKTDTSRGWMISHLLEGRVRGSWSYVPFRSKIGVPCWPRQPPMQTFERLVMAGASRQNGAVVGLVCMRQPVVLAANTL